MFHPIKALGHVIASYRDYLTTEFRARDPKLRQALEDALEREGFLAQEPFFSASQPFKSGKAWADLPLDSNLAGALRKRSGGNPTYLHQSLAIEHLLSPKPGSLVISTGTGSGKTEAFLAPVLQAAVQDSIRTGKKPGMVALLLYPMNALANDQQDRIKWYLRESGWDGSVSVAMYNRGTTQQERQDLRDHPPHVLLTNYQMLEYLLVRPADREALFQNHRMRFVILDEVHTYGGTLGTHVAFLVRRLKAHLLRANPKQSLPIFVGASATIASDDQNEKKSTLEEREQSIQNFFGRLTGVDPEQVMIISEETQEISAPPDAQYASSPFAASNLDLDDPLLLRRALAMLTDLPEDIPLPELARRSRLLWDLNEWLGKSAKSISSLVNLVQNNGGGRSNWDKDTVSSEVELALSIGAALAASDDCGGILGALRMRAHNFVRGGWEFHRCLNPSCGTLYARGETECRICGTATAPLYLCRNCGADFWGLIGNPEGAGAMQPFTQAPAEDAAFQESEMVQWLLFQKETWKAAGYEEDIIDAEYHRVSEDGSIYEVEPEEEIETTRRAPKSKGKKLDIIEGSWIPDELTFLPNTPGLIPASIYPSRKKCPNCGSSGGPRAIITPVSLGTSAALKVISEGLIEALPGDENDKKRILIFADSRQDAAHQARFIEFAARYDRMRFRVTHLLAESSPQSLGKIVENLGKIAVEKQDNPYLRQIPGGYSVPRGDERAKYYAWEEAPLLDDLAVNARYRATLENLGLVNVNYSGLNEFVDEYAQSLSGNLGFTLNKIGFVLGQLLDVIRRAGALNRDLLKAHPDGQHNHEVLNSAKWERRIKGPIGLPADELGKPSLRYEQEISGGVRVQPVWGAKGRQANPQRLLNHLARRFSHPALTEDSVLILLELLVNQQFLVLEQLHGYRGKPVSLYQLNSGLLELSFATEVTRRRCDTCSLVIHLPEWAQFEGDTPCPRCESGILKFFSDEEVFQSRYAKRAINPQSIPLKAAEHTAQVPGNKRKELEDQFKSSAAPLNVLACSPTLELGIHVGGLEAVALRNVPPRPDNYAQRGGRAGRDERVGLVVGYTRNTPHDQYFYEHPEEMIAGAVPVPAFNLGNRDALIRHLYAIAFGLAEPGIAGRMADYVTFKGEVQQEKVDELLEGLRSAKNIALVIAQEAFSDEVLKQASYTLDDFSRFLDELPDRVQDVFNRTARQIAHLHTVVATWADIGGQPWIPMRAGRMINQLLGIETANQEFRLDVGSAYPLRRLAEAGLLPGYEFPVEPATLRLLGDEDEWSTLSTGRPSGLRQYQPEAPVYARGKRWKVIGIDLTSPWNPQGREPTWYYQRCSECNLVFDPQVKPTCPRCGSTTVGFNRPAMDFAGFLARSDQATISDEEDRRYGRNLVEIHPSWQTGGEQPVAGKWKLADGWRLEWRRGEKVVWLNEGMPDKQGVKDGYLICPECGKLLKPEVEKKSKSKGRKAAKDKDQNLEGHARNCSLIGQTIPGLALYAEGQVDTLRLLFPWFGDPDNPGDITALDQWALTLGYSLLTGAERHFALASEDLDFIWEGFRPQTYNGNKFNQGIITIIDPNIGGSGYLERIAEELDQVAAAALRHLDHQGCESACYRCLKSYENQRYHHLLTWPAVTGVLEGLRNIATSRMSLTAAEIDDPQPWIDAYTAGCGSPLEHRFLRLMQNAGLSPVLQHPIPDEAGIPFTIADFAFTEKRIAIYIDGVAYHKGDRLRKDRAIDQRLQSLADPWKVMRISAKDINRGEAEIITNLRQMLE